MLLLIHEDVVFPIWVKGISPLRLADKREKDSGRDSVLELVKRMQWRRVRSGCFDAWALAGLRLVQNTKMSWKVWGSTEVCVGLLHIRQSDLVGRWLPACQDASNPAITVLFFQDLWVKLMQS